MALAQNRLIAAVAGRLRSKVGVRFTRFVVVAAAALCATEVALTLCNGVFHMTATPAALVSWFSGAVVSYVLSRWAWERKGRPHVLKETLPFWAVSLGTWLFMGAVSHYTGIWATSAHFAHWERTGIINGAFFVANCVTFAARFVILHYVLFADRGTAKEAEEEPVQSA